LTHKLGKQICGNLSQELGTAIVP